MCVSMWMAHDEVVSSFPFDSIRSLIVLRPVIDDRKR